MAQNLSIYIYIFHLISNYGYMNLVMTTYFGMHINLTFIHDLCYVSYYFEVIKDSKGQQKVKKGHFFNYLKMTEKFVNILFER